MDLVVFDGNNPSWLGGAIFIDKAKEKLSSYFNQPIPIPPEAELEEKLKFYLPPR